MNPSGETIAALATQPGESGVAIVRISGPAALVVADRVFRCAGEPPSKKSGGSFVYGHTVNPLDGTRMDEALVLIFRAPKSYTREDVAEIHGHGGRVAATRLLRAVLDGGARLAEPGEFTKRAFLSGRIDLVQAEAVMDLVKAQSDRAAAAAMEQLGGELSRKFNQIFDLLLELATRIEAALDFPEDELPTDIINKTKVISSEVILLFKRALETWSEGKLLRDGAKVVISGKPNVGKSTLLNALLNSNRAIVSPIPGTTRDTIEEDCVIGDVPLRLVDTAGIRETKCEIEAEGIRRTREAMDDADLHIYMADMSQEPEQDVLDHIARMPSSKSILLMNKCDLPHKWPPIISALPPNRVVKVSLHCEQDVHRARAVVLEAVSAGFDLSARPHATISERHRKVMSEAMALVEDADRMIGSGREELLALSAAQVREALHAMGQVTGRVYHEELLESIFSSFCIGK